MIITLDKDFGELVYKSGLNHSGVLLLRMEDARAHEKVLAIELILNEYADEYVNYGQIQQGDTDVSGNGEVDIQDIVNIALNLGYTASEQKCSSSALQHVSGNTYRVTASGRGLYYVGVAYKVLI